MALAVAMIGAASPLQAQTASQITPPSFAPPARTPDAPLVIPSSGANDAPAGADTVSVRLADVTLDGAEDPAALAMAKARLVRRTVTLAEVFAVAREIEAGYAQRGRILTRVVVPAQTLADGATLRLTVVRGTIARIDASGVTPSVRGRLMALLNPLVGNADVTLGEIERRLLLASDMPGVTMRSTLTAGETPGSTVIVLNGKWAPVSGFVTFDNTLSESLGRSAFGLGATLNSVLGAGETIYVQASGLPNTGRRTSFLDPTPRNRALAGGMILPLGDNGLSYNVELTDARTAPRHDARLPGFGSRFQRLSNRLRYPVIRRRSLTVTAEGTLDMQNERVEIIDPVVLPLSLDRLRIARAAGDVAAWLPGGGFATFKAEMSFGLDALGARSASDATVALPLSRAGSDASFRKLQVSGQIEQPVASHLTLWTAARAQTAFGQAMANAEQFGVATTQGLSPLPSGAIQGDAGYVARTEVRLPLAFSLPIGSGRITPYGFGAAAGVRLEKPTMVERRSTQAYAYGAGLRIAGAAQDGKPGIAAGLEYGRAHVEGRSAADRLTVNFITQF